MKKLIIAVFSLIVLPSILLAQSSGSVSITLFPAVSEYAVNPGETIQATLRVENTETSPLPVQISANSLLPFDEVTETRDITRYNASSWFEIREPQAVLPSNQVVELDYSIDVPEDAAPGGHYAQITIRQLRAAPQKPDSSLAEIIPEVNASILITVAGDINESLTLNTEDLTSSRLNKDSANTFGFSIANNGNTHSLPSVRLDITNDQGLVDSIAFQPQLILPGTQRQFEAEWLANQDYGSYEARVFVEYGTPKQTIESEAVSFTVTPEIWQMAAAVAGGSLLLLMIIRWRQLPRAFDVLKGRAAGVAGSYRRSGGSYEMDEKDDSDYSEVVKELERQRPILGLPAEESSIITDEDTAKVAQETDKQEAAKREKAKTQELIAEEIKRDAQISEEVHEDTASKTVIIQTGATTIVREEPIIEQAEAQKEPTVTKIMVVDHGEPETKKDGKKPKPKKSAKKSSKKKPAKKKTSSKKTKATSKAKKKSPKKPKSKKKKSK